MKAMDYQEMTNEVQTLSRWSLNEKLDKGSNTIPYELGYFGKYVNITYKGKQTIVEADPRDAHVTVVTNWYDEIFYGSEKNGEGWSADHRWNTDEPLIARDGDRYYIVLPHGKRHIELEEGVKVYSNFRWRRFKGFESFYAVHGFDKNGRSVIINKEGVVFYAKKNIERELDRELALVKTYTKEDVISKWIKMGKPCAHIHGLEYKGARMGYITEDRALELIKDHFSFNCHFNSAEWMKNNGKLILVFRDYANSDYD